MSPSTTRVPRTHPAVAASWVLGAAAIATQMAFPFTDGGSVALTILSVVLLASSALVHVSATRGLRSAAGLVLVAAGGGLAAEAVGVRTGVPFGPYDYTGTLGPELVGVPVVVPLAWLMMAYPALLAARRLTGSRLALAPLVAGWALTTWDVFLDPQMVDAGHWRWDRPTPSLPGVADIPVTNFAGWLVVATLMCFALDRVVARRPRDTSDRDALPLAVFLWTYASSVLAHAAFFGRPPVALVGGLLMGTVAIPLVVRLIWSRAR